MSGASFVYPAGGNFSNVAPNGLVNIFDKLEISYASSWDALNLTLFCLVGDVASDYAVWNVPTNPLGPTGTYWLSSVSDVGFGIVKFPTLCSFKLTQYGDNDIARGGENFQLVSDPSTSTTYCLASTSGSAATTTQASASTSTSSNIQASSTSSSVASSTDSNSPSSSSVSSIARTTKSPSTSTTSSSTSTDGLNAILPASATPTEVSGSSSQQSGLSIGAKAGIAVGAILVVAVIAALCFIIFRLRKKASRSIQEIPETSYTMQKPESALPAYADVTDKPAYAYNVHELEHTDRVEMPNQPMRVRPGELE